VSPASNLQALGSSAAQPAASPVKPEPAVAKTVPAVAKQPAAPVAAVAKAPVAQIAPAQMAPRATPAPAAVVAQAPAPAPASQQTGLESETNPFTGRDLSAEQRQRQLENAKMDTDLIQEKLKQANLIADLTYLPLKKKAEVSTLPGVAKDLTATATASALATAKPAREATEKAARKPVKKRRHSGPGCGSPCSTDNHSFRHQH
jgi:hypothetical protein